MLSSRFVIGGIISRRVSIPINNSNAEFFDSVEIIVINWPTFVLHRIFSLVCSLLISFFFFAVYQSVQTGRWWIGVRTERIDQLWDVESKCFLCGQNCSSGQGNTQGDPGVIVTTGPNDSGKNSVVVFSSFSILFVFSFSYWSIDLVVIMSTACYRTLTILHHLQCSTIRLSCILVFTLP